MNHGHFWSVRRIGAASDGRPKLDAARERLADLNPGVRVELHEGRLSSANAMEILKAYDVVADGTDNFPTRYLVNDACFMARKPLVSAAMMRFDGQLTTFRAFEGEDLLRHFVLIGDRGYARCGEVSQKGQLRGMRLLLALDFLKYLGQCGPKARRGCGRHLFAEFFDNVEDCVNTL